MSTSREAIGGAPFLRRMAAIAFAALVAGCTVEAPGVSFVTDDDPTGSI